MISVLLATHNGADTIERTLAALSQLDVPAGGWNLILVNNASTDDTESRVLKWRERLPLTYLVEPRLGKSKAMNTALRHATGDLIVMTDDDVLPERNWLSEWRRVADALPGCSVFGGAVVPSFDKTPPPSYVSHRYYGVLYGETHPYSEGAIEPSPDTGLFHVSGANIAIRKSVHENGNRFDENFLVGSQGLMGEDTEFVRRLGTSGYKVGFAPSAVVHHIVHPHQTSWRWIHHRLFRNGRAAFMLQHARWDDAAGKFAYRFPWSRLYPITGAFFRLLLAGLRGDKKNAFLQSHGLAQNLAAIRQALNLCRQQKAGLFHGRPDRA